MIGFNSAIGDASAEASPKPFLGDLFSEGCKCRNYVTKKCVPRKKQQCETNYR